LSTNHAGLAKKRQVDLSMCSAWKVRDVRCVDFDLYRLLRCCFSLSCGPARLSLTGIGESQFNPNWQWIGTARIGSNPTFVKPIPGQIIRIRAKSVTITLIGANPNIDRMQPMI
jgi:hypothetical protein